MCAKSLETGPGLGHYHRAALWPLFLAERVLIDDGWLVAINKPVGVPCQAREPGDRDDLLTRLRAYFDDGYLGMHQRLDQETSGVMVFARRREANAALAKQFEGRRVRKVYVAAVQGWRGGSCTLQHWLALRKGRSQVHDRPRRGAREAVSHVSVRTKTGNRALLQVEIETGRTHQIRAQLAHIGFPVVGDRLYGGGTSGRLMLHSEKLRLVHPKTGESVEFHAPIEADFDCWLRGADEPFQLVWRRALERRYRLGHDDRTSAFRLLHRDAEGELGVAIDHYGHESGCHAVVHFFDHANEARVLDELHGFDGLYVKRHPKEARAAAQVLDHLAPSEPVRGVAASESVVVVENGLRFQCQLASGLPTGLYLDQRIARQRVRDAAHARRVLNLFAYTGAFTVAAAAGGAERTVTVDLSKRSLQQLETNLSLNDLDGSHRVLAADCFEFLKSAAADGQQYDLVICDPPTYARSKNRRWTSGVQWRDLAASCFEVAAPGAIVLLCSNDVRMSNAKFRRFVHDAARSTKRTIQSMRDVPSPPDFPAPRTNRVKRLWIEL